MKKIIKGKKYNTETATCVGTFQYSYLGDFYYLRETLYRKKSGDYFLHGEGGPASRYGVTVGLNKWIGNEDIIVMNVNEAKEWSKEHLGADEYVAEFGEFKE